jgi:hypothetical protein
MLLVGEVVEPRRYEDVGDVPRLELIERRRPRLLASQVFDFTGQLSEALTSIPPPSLHSIRAMN